MMSINYTLLTLTLVAAAAGVGPGVAQVRENPNEVLIDEGQRPSQVRRSFQGSCAGVSYGISLSPGDRREGGGMRSLTVNGREVRASALATIDAAIPATVFLMDASFDRCGAGGARARLTLADPASNNSLRFIIFWVDPDGRISELRSR